MDVCQELSFIVKDINQKTRPSLMPKNVVRFNFSLKIKIKNYNLVQTPTSSTLRFMDVETLETSASHKETFTKSSSEYKTEYKMRIALYEALASLCLSDVECTMLTGKALDEFHRTLRDEPLCRNGCFSMYINFEMELTHEHIYYSWYDMVPASESSFRLLEKVDCLDVKDENCCICFEEFSDGGRLLSMPCEHVFHGRCIEKWLSNSHYCPMCRFEMPT